MPHKMKETPITFEEANRLLRYDPETGFFFWRVRRGNKRPGDRAGTSHKKDGRIIIEINHSGYHAARLAWLLMMGKHPEHFIDHADNNPANNAWRNLRPATPLQNARNCRKNGRNQHGLKGATWYAPLGKWAAKIRVNGRLLHLGYYPTPEAAHAEYVKAAVLHFGEFARAA